MPPIKRRKIDVELDDDHAAAYAAYEDACRDLLVKLKEDDDVDLSGSFLHTSPPGGPNT